MRVCRLYLPVCVQAAYIAALLPSCDQATITAVFGDAPPPPPAHTRTLSAPFEADFSLLKSRTVPAGMAKSATVGLPLGLVSRPVSLHHKHASHAEHISKSAGNATPVPVSPPAPAVVMSAPASMPATAPPSAPGTPAPAPLPDADTHPRGPDAV